MNNVELIGRLTKDPDIRYTKEQKCVASFFLAVRKDKDTTYFPKVVVFGRMAETVEKYVHKGSTVGITGELHTDRYENKNGDMVYTTEVYTLRLDLLWSDEKPKDDHKDTPPDFEQIEGDIPF